MSAPSHPSADTVPARKGDWIQTFSGRAFWPFDPRSEDIDIGDIAHALAHQCRYAGHVRRFYSVAEHSVLIARHVSPPHRLWALLHDASEAYLVDLPRPVKRAVVGYREAEAVVTSAICERFGLGRDMPREVHLADGRILTDERQQAMAPPPMPWDAEEQGDALGVTLGFWAPARAKKEFLTLFETLMARRAPDGEGGHGAF